MAISPDIVTKLRPLDENVWHGYLYPEEIATLLDLGCRPTVRSNAVLSRLPDLRRAEKPARWWFYFIPAPDHPIPSSNAPYPVYDFKSAE